LSVEDIMTRKVVTIDGDKTVGEAAKLMRRKKIGALVVTEKDKPVGIITEKDICERIVAESKPNTTKVKEVMSKPLITIKPKSLLTDAVELMTKHGIRRLVVMDKGKLVGIVAARDFVKNWVKFVEIFTYYIIKKA